MVQYNIYTILLYLYIYHLKKNTYKLRVLVGFFKRLGYFSFYLFSVPGGPIMVSRPFRRPPSPQTDLRNGQAPAGSRRGARIGVFRPSPGLGKMAAEVSPRTPPDWGIPQSAPWRRPPQNAYICYITHYGGRSSHSGVSYGALL